MEYIDGRARQTSFRLATRLSTTTWGEWFRLRAQALPDAEDHPGRAIIFWHIAAELAPKLRAKGF
jgi:hypothetical protein